MQRFVDQFGLGRQLIERSGELQQMLIALHLGFEFQLGLHPRVHDTGRADEGRDRARCVANELEAALEPQVSAVFALQAVGKARLLKLRFQQTLDPPTRGLTLIRMNKPKRIGTQHFVRLVAEQFKGRGRNVLDAAVDQKLPDEVAGMVSQTLVVALTRFQGLLDFFAAGDIAGIDQQAAHLRMTAQIDADALQPDRVPSAVPKAGRHGDGLTL